ncbi:MAG: hypothetical protein AAGI03_10345 [Pseudomonadota bacterium]
MARDMFVDAWEQRQAQAGEDLKTLKTNLARIDRQIDRYVDGVGEASSDATIKVYERKIDTLERERMIAEEKLQTMGLQTGTDGKSARENSNSPSHFSQTPGKYGIKADPTCAGWC